MQNHSYKQDYHRTLNPLQNYYANSTTDPKAAQIKKYSPFYLESRVQRILPFLNLNQNKKSSNLLRNLSYSQEPLVKILKRFYRPHAWMKMESIHTLSQKHWKALFSILQVNNARKNSQLRSHQEKFHKFLVQFRVVLILIWKDTQL